MDSAARLASGLQTLLRRPPTGRELDAFSSYLSLLLQWNRVHSLTAYRDPADILDKLFLDSLLFRPFLPFPPCRVLDLGSGAGIPGVPLKIVEPSYQLTLIESRRSRASFLSTVVRELGLQDVNVLRGRAESLLSEIPALERAFDAVVARAVGRLDAVAPLALRFLKPGGRFVASGPPGETSVSAYGVAESWEVIISQISGRPRRFWVAQKT